MASQAPPAHAVTMPSVAAAAGVRVDVVDSGAGNEFARPSIEDRGPLANSLTGRMTGSSEQVDALAELVSQRVDGIANDRVNGGPPA